jgi:hypothetical protein
VPLVIALTGHLRQTVAHTIPAAVRVLTPRRRAVILRQAGAILLQAGAIPLQAVHIRPHRTRRLLAMDRPGAGILRAAAEAEAAQDRTAGNS